jgi:DNA-binding transcriptional LysR family regulator
VNLRSIDLNLLVIFDALMAEKSLSAAARKVGMTPSAASHALQRLRTTFNDPLIERTARGMVPTRRALDLITAVRDGLQQLKYGIGNQLDFDPATAERTFNVRLSDFMMDCLLPRLCARLRAEAPGVMLVVDHLPRDGSEAYEPGDIQLRVDARVPGPKFGRERIWRDPFVIAMRRRHPAAKSPISLDRFMELPYLDVSSVVIDTRTLDEFLESKGLTRRASVTIPSLSAVVPILQHSDLCAILPRRWVDLYSAPSRLATVPLPLDGIEYAVDMIWHSRDDRDAGHRWLRNLIVQEFAVLYAPTNPAVRSGRHSPDKLDVLSPLSRSGRRPTAVMKAAHRQLNTLK